MNEYYDALMKLKGADELHALIRKWDALSANIRRLPTDAPILLPDILLYTKPGYGNTTLLSLLADYLESKQNLMSFRGDVKFFEFMLGYKGPYDSFSDLSRLMEEARVAAGFRSDFKGIVRIKIDEWLGHHEEKHFLEFLEYVASNSDNWLLILTLAEAPDERSKAMEALISMYLRIETVHLRLPDSGEIMEYIASQLSAYGLTFTPEAAALLRESVKKLRKNKYFDGMHTIRLFCGDIAYHCFTIAREEGEPLTAETLRFFAADGDYISRKITKNNERSPIGFGA